MQIGIFDAGINELAVKYIKNELDKVGISYFTISSRSHPKSANCIIVLGGDRGVRNYFHVNDDDEIFLSGDLLRVMKMEKRIANETPFRR